MRRRYIVKGRVQGVGFRQFAAEKARALNVAGWVRNLPDGSVEAEAEAEQAALASFEGFLEKGPGFSRVTSLTKAELNNGAALPEPFEIRR